MIAALIYNSTVVCSQVGIYWLIQSNLRAIHCIISSYATAILCLDSLFCWSQEVRVQLLSVISLHMQKSGKHIHSDGLKGAKGSLSMSFKRTSMSLSHPLRSLSVFSVQKVILLSWECVCFWAHSFMSNQSITLCRNKCHFHIYIISPKRHRYKYSLKI